MSHNLSKGSLQVVKNLNPSDQPPMDLNWQVTNIKGVQQGEGKLRYRLQLSDGVTRMNGMLVVQLNHLVDGVRLQENSIIRAKHYSVSKIGGIEIIVLLNIEILGQAEGQMKHENIPPATFLPPRQQQQQQQQTGSTPMSLPQVLRMFDSRLVTLEKATKEAKPDSSVVESQGVSKEETNAIKEILNEYDERFKMLAGEIQEMKSALMKLQNYTMDVNKTLLEERVRYMTPVANTSSPSTVDQPIDYDNIIATSEMIEMRDWNT